VPAYNAEATIDETLRSVRSQTHRELEIIIVDDGSTDSTVSIAKKHAVVDARIRVISQKNSGVATARNTGWWTARSNYIAFVDADDLWAPTKIERQLDALLSGGENVGLVYTWFREIDEKGRILKRAADRRISGNVLEHILSGNFVGNGSSALVRRRALVEVGGFEPALQVAGAHGCEDWLFYYRVAVKFDFALVPDHLTGYRSHAERMSSNRPRMLRSWLMVADEMKLDYPIHRNLVQKGLRYYLGYLFEDALRRGDLSQIPTLVSMWLPECTTRPITATLVMFMMSCLRCARRLSGTALRKTGIYRSRRFPIGEVSS
jgi:glycosyltransferase involved in cell wall biosynthesis